MNKKQETVSDVNRPVTDEKHPAKPKNARSRKKRNCRDGKPAAMKKENVERQGRSNGIFYTQAVGPLQFMLHFAINSQVHVCFVYSAAKTRNGS